jgi:hypothetical protein
MRRWRRRHQAPLHPKSCTLLLSLPHQHLRLLFSLCMLVCELCSVPHTTMMTPMWPDATRNALLFNNFSHPFWTVWPWTMNISLALYLWLPWIWQNRTRELHSSLIEQVGGERKWNSQSESCKRVHRLKRNVVDVEHYVYCEISMLRRRC